MNFHWLFGHKYKLKKLYYKSIIDNIYSIDYYKIIIYGYYRCDCGKDMIETLPITEESCSEKRFVEKVNYLRTLGYIDNMEFYDWLANETSEEQKTENANTKEEE